MPNRAASRDAGSSFAPKTNAPKWGIFRVKKKDRLGVGIAGPVQALEWHIWGGTTPEPCFTLTQHP
jgi:hypothetical protein